MVEFDCYRLGSGDSLALLALLPRFIFISSLLMIDNNLPTSI